jgi:hypothetical protein
VLLQPQRLHPVTETISFRMSAAEFSYAGYLMPAETMVLPMIDTEFLADRTFNVGDGGVAG